MSRSIGLAPCVATLLATVVTSVVTSVVAADAFLLKDDFSAKDSKSRRAIRGDWQVENGVASCTQDDELYKKFKNHGPIIFYDLPFTDATVRFMFKSKNAKAVTFTANGESGHIFRVSWGPRGTNVRAFPPDSKEKPVSVGQDAKPSPQEVWIPVEVVLKGSKATVKVGDAPEQVYEHESFARPKTNISVGFSFGSVSVKDLSVTP